jgi:pyruvate dehydrogenase E2 component (dihydrolipoamide acetyltransferase)
MAKFEFKLPDIGEGVAEGEIVNWLVKAGDTIQLDQEMVEVMTDKATVTIASPKAGKVLELGGAVGDVVPVGKVLVVLDLEGGGAALPEPQPKQERGGSVIGDLQEDLPGTGLQPQREVTVSSQKPLAAPATRKLARELGVDLSGVSGSGAAGRITREDVETRASKPSQSSSLAVSPSAVVQPLPPPAAPPRSKEDTRVAIRGLRKRIFENMARSKRTAAHFAYADEVDCSELIALKQRVQPFAEEAGVKLTFLPFIVKATVAALKKHPALNAWVDDANYEIVQKASFDIGVATATDAGLMVPVIRNADRLSIVEIAKEISRLAADARSGKSRPEDLGGSTFTVTSLGKLGGLFSTPVVNYPEVAIMGIHEMKRKPVVVGDEIKIGNVMVLALSFDHRVIDGHIGAAFAQEVKGFLEKPDRLLIQMG